MVCPNCGQEINSSNVVCPFCNQPLREKEGSNFYDSFEINEVVTDNVPKVSNKAYIPKKSTEGLGAKIAVGIIVVIILVFVIIYFTTSHIFCQNNTGGKFGVFYTRNRIIYCFQTGQGPGDCKAVNSVSKDDLERLGYNDYESFIQSLKIQIEETGMGVCQ